MKNLRFKTAKILVMSLIKICEDQRLGLSRVLFTAGKRSPQYCNLKTDFIFSSSLKTPHSDDCLIDDTCNNFYGDKNVINVYGMVLSD